MRNFYSIALLLTSSEAFTPSVRSIAGIRHQSSSTTSRSFGIEPMVFHDSLVSIGNTFSSLTIADAEPVVDAAAEVAQANNGWFGFLTGPIYAILDFLHSLVAGTGTANSWGISIIALTVLIKVVTFPLTKTQLDSTNKMQAIAPAVKDLQAKYQSNPEVMNQKVAEFYQVNEINPLAGCLPSLIQIPVFIGLYRAVLDLAQENRLDEPFLFLPSLEGPTYGADPTTGSDWILKGWCVYTECGRQGENRF
jgi:membrane protein insertase Oxa1/YidC/SpoIIIJ